MLRETLRFRNYGGHLDRRVFTDSDMDLYIWFNQDVPERFHLIYNKRRRSHAVSWNNESGFGQRRFIPIETLAAITGLSDIRDAFIQPDYEKTPASVLAYQFLQASSNMAPWLADFIYARLLEYPGRDAMRINPGTALRSF